MREPPWKTKQTTTTPPSRWTRLTMTPAARRCCLRMHVPPKNRTPLPRASRWAPPVPCPPLKKLPPKTRSPCPSGTPCATSRSACCLPWWWCSAALPAGSPGTTPATPLAMCPPTSRSTGRASRVSPLPRCALWSTVTSSPAPPAAPCSLSPRSRWSASSTPSSAMST